jgi:hypothetical protein
LCNLAETNPSRLTRLVADLYLAKEFTAPEPMPRRPGGPAISLSEQQLSGYAGLYWNRDDEQTLRIVQKEKRLVAVISPRQSYPVKPIANNRFRAEGPPVEMEFGKSGQAGSMTLSFKTDGAPNVRLFEAMPEFQPTAEQLHAYAGSYQSDEIESVYRIEIEDGGLTLKRLKVKPDKLQPAISDYFRGVIGSVHFLRNSGGQVSGFVLNGGRIKDFHFRKSGG